VNNRAVPINPFRGINVKHHKHKEFNMSQIVDALTAIGKLVAANRASVDPAHLAAIDAHLAKLDSAVGADEATEADTTAGLQAFIAAANGTSSAAGAAAPVATAPGNSSQAS
jgi:DNA-binding GntR family transcriptional regulator